MPYAVWIDHGHQVGERLTVGTPEQAAAVVAGVFLADGFPLPGITKIRSTVIGTLREGRSYRTLLPDRVRYVLTEKEPTP